MNIVVVGGGSAGWITALYSKKKYPKHNIILIESDKIGILGAGEGSTPHLVDLFNFLEIPTKDLIKNCNATIKNGIKFTNWSDSKESFFHPFFSNIDASNDANFSINSHLEEDTCFSHIYANKFNHSFDEYIFIQRLSNKNKVPFVKNINRYKENNYEKFLNLSYWSLHFDANLLAQYLKKIGIQRGIVRKEGIVKEIISNPDGDIIELRTDNDFIKTDFIFDCTGFKREIIGNFYKSKWLSYSEYLPAKKALPFFLPITKKIPPYTEAIAMNFGWMWKIPTQDRYGCGYVFDSNFIGEDEAKREIDNFLGFDVYSPKTFSFEAGVYEKIWINNCMAIGLSSGFIEPLEATSIWQSYKILKKFFSMSIDLKNNSEKIKEIINKQYLIDSQEIVDFLSLHYITDKKNTNFWKHFKENNKVPESVENILEIIKYKPLQETDILNNFKNFSIRSFFYILVGNNILTDKQLNNYLLFNEEEKTKEYFNILKKQNNTIASAMDHNNFINEIKYCV